MDEAYIPQRDEGQGGAAPERFDRRDPNLERSFDDLCALAAQICGAPFALITIAGNEHRWSSSTGGASAGEAPPEDPFSTRVAALRDLLVVPDVARDPTHAAEPRGTANAKIRFYAGAPLLAPDGDVLGTLCVMDRAPRSLTAPQQEALRALSRQVVAQLELHRSKHILAPEASGLLAAIVASSADAIIGKDLDGIVTSWNRGAERIFGYTADEMIGSPILRLIPEDRLDEERGSSRGSAAARRSATSSGARTKDGRLIDVSISASPVKDATGKVIGAAKLARDITERKRAEEELRFQQTMLATERELTLDGILVVDDDSRVLSFNGRFAEMWGISDDVSRPPGRPELLEAVRDKLVYPDRFMERVRQLYDDSRRGVAGRGRADRRPHLRPLLGPHARPPTGRTTAASGTSAT